MEFGLATIGEAGDSIAYLDRLSNPLIETQCIGQQQRGSYADRVVAG
jgi:hypothetical protein